MKQFIFNIIFIFLFNQCASPSKTYEGHIYNKKKEPLANIKICEQNKNNCTHTDGMGFFKLKKNESSINDLVLYKNNKSIDTIKTVWEQHGEKINYSFIQGRKDTIFIDAK